ncbi:PIN domain-containing protein [uncultured Enterovirga sp.]|uniref:PIN domain-containing protein n=1 Tax=uncultured Enterovirga sp. TaxID=2026352 RepID=UPI0035C9EB60
MSIYLLDTSILSELAPGRRGLPPPWLVELGRSPGGTRLSVISLIEIEGGISKLRRAGAEQRASSLEDWLKELLSEFGADIILVDRELARAVGRLSDRAVSIGRHPGLADIAIGATAQAHGLSLLTRNLRHFAPLGITAVDPFASLPP